MNEMQIDSNQVTRLRGILIWVYFYA